MAHSKSRIFWTALFLGPVPICLAGVETVRVSKILDDDDKAIIERRNGESYLIEKGIGCRSLWRFEGKEILILSPGLFLGVGSKVLIPEADQECRIWDSEELSSTLPTVGPTAATNAPSRINGQRDTSNTRRHNCEKASECLGSELSALRPSSLTALSNALKLLGQDPGPADGKWNSKLGHALDVYVKSQEINLAPGDLSRILTLIAIDVVVKNATDKSANQIAVALIKEPVPMPDPKAIATNVPLSIRNTDCESGHWISSVSNSGEVVVLEDGSVWLIDSLDRIDTQLWIATEDVVICDDQLINVDTGDAVDASRMSR